MILHNFVNYFANAMEYIPEDLYLQLPGCELSQGGKYDNHMPSDQYLPVCTQLISAAQWLC